jgi:hypothetical protein
MVAPNPVAQPFERRHLDEAVAMAAQPFTGEEFLEPTL